MRKKSQPAPLTLFEPVAAPTAPTNQKKSATALERPNREGFTTHFQSTQDLLKKYQVKETNKYIAHEFQSFGCYLAETLADTAHTSLYIRLAKQQPRSILEQALRFVVDSQARNKAKLFMWKLHQLNQLKKTKTPVSAPIPEETT